MGKLQDDLFTSHPGILFIIQLDHLYRELWASWSSISKNCNYSCLNFFSAWFFKITLQKDKMVKRLYEHKVIKQFTFKIHLSCRFIKIHKTCWSLEFFCLGDEVTAAVIHFWFQWLSDFPIVDIEWFLRIYWGPEKVLSSEAIGMASQSLNCSALYFILII